MKDIRKRDSSWTMFKPGLYFDPAGNAHVFPDEVIAELSRLHPEVPWNYDDDYWLILRYYQQELGENVKIIQHIRETD